MIRFLKEKSFRLKDLLVLLIVIALGFAVVSTGAWAIFPMSTTSAVDAAYSAKMADDGTLYVLDEGHQRLVHTDTEGNILGQVLSSDFGSGYMYIDDFAFDEQGNIFLQGSEWDGMYLSQEYIYQFDASGALIGCVFDETYERVTVNKHRIYGMAAHGGELTYLLLNADDVTAVTMDYAGNVLREEVIPYPNAFNAVSDAIRLDDAYYILDKSGRILLTGSASLSTTWNMSTCEDAASYCPYRLCMDAEKHIYFTDIRGGRVCRVYPGSAMVHTICEGTGTLTVGVGVYQGTNVLIVTEFDSVSLVNTYTGEELCSVTTLYKPSGDVVRMWLLLALDIVNGLMLLLLLIRVCVVVHAHGLSAHAKTQIGVLSMLLIVAAIIIYILMSQFSDQFRTQLCSQVESAAYMIATQVDAEDIQAVNAAADFNGEAYGRLTRIMADSYSKDVAFYDGVYCNILRYDGDGPAYAVAYLDQSIGTYFPLDEFESDEVIQVYETGASVWNDGKDDISGSYIYVKVPVKNKDGQVAGVIAAGMDISSMNAMMNDMVKKVLLALIIIILLILLGISEITGFINARSDYRKLSASNTQALPGHSLRLLVFAVFTAYNISSTFLPVYLLSKAGSIGFISKELAASLPITINIFAIGVMSLVCARLVQRVGLKGLGIISGLLSLVGNLLIFAVPYYPAIFLGLLLDGIGVGLISNVLYIMITYVKDSDSRRSGFSIYNAACLSGINFGMMLGAILAVNMGEQNVFACVAAIWAIVLLLTLKVSKEIRRLLGDSAASDEAPDGQQGGKKLGLRAFLRQKGVVSFYTLIQNPYIIFNSFVFFYVPIFCDSNGYDETITALLLMLYALLSVYTGEAITKAMSKALGNKSMYVSLLLNVAAVVLFAWNPTISFLVLALVILGFSASFGKTIQQEYYMEMEPVERYGKDDAMGVYNFTENIGESLGPIIFGRIMFCQPLSWIVTGFGAIIAALTGIHFAKHRKDL